MEKNTEKHSERKRNETKNKKMPLILFFANQEKARRLGRWK